MTLMKQFGCDTIDFKVDPARAKRLNIVNKLVAFDCQLKGVEMSPESIDLKAEELLEEFVRAMPDRGEGELKGWVMTKLG